MKTLKKTIENGKVYESLIEIDTFTGEIISHKTKQISLKEKPELGFSVLLDSGEKAIYKLKTVNGITTANRYYPPSTKSWLDFFVPNSSKAKALCVAVFDEIREINETEKVQISKLESLPVNDTVVELMNSVSDNAVNNRLRSLKKLQDLLDKYNGKHGTLNTIEDFAAKLEAVQGISCNLAKADNLD